MIAKFEKWHGCKNDFIVIWSHKILGESFVNNVADITEDLCSRDGSGVGADGILILETELATDNLPQKLYILNSDGSRAHNCGNGLRCAAGSVYRRWMNSTSPSDEPESVTFEVEGRDFTCDIMKSGEDDTSPMISVSMGEVILNDQNEWFQAARDAVSKICTNEGIKFGEDQIFAADVGNKHIVLFTESANRETMLSIGSKLQDFSSWDGINFHIVDSHSPNSTIKNIGLKFDPEESSKAWCYERGVGETMACGSGATAIGVSKLLDGFSSRAHWTLVEMPGGNLFVKQTEENGPAYLAGPAEFVFEGTIQV